MKNLKRIAIIGNAGSGKSTLAQTLHQILKLPVYHLDKYFWKPNWIHPDLNEYRLIHDKICDQDKWIIDGNNLSVSEYRFKNADTIIFLNISRYKCIWRIIKRAFKYYGKATPTSADQCIENFFDLRFLNFLKWVWNFKKRNLNKIIELLAFYAKNKEIYILRSQYEIDEFIKKLSDY